MSELDAVLAKCADLLATFDPATVPAEVFLGAQFDHGLAWVHFPLGHGGLGLAPGLQVLIDETLQGAGAPVASQRNVIGHGMGAPTLISHGSDTQRARYLRPLFTGEEIWCQMFSEPSAGSDVAGLATRAVRDGDEWVINGQKVWTTLAHCARWGMLATRSDPDVPKHQGMTYFVLDMNAPGVEVRPLFQITGEAEFNEVYLTDVRLPDSERLGDVGEGWRVIVTILMNERVAIGGGVPAKGAGFIGEALDLWEDTSGTSHALRRRQRDELTRLWIRAEVLRMTNIRAAQARSSGNPGPEGSIGKAMSAALNQDISTFAVDVLGAHGMLKADGYPMERVDDPKPWDNPIQAFLRARANSIEGGTSEIAKNILGERVLGLPGDQRTDKDVPWAQVPRG
jgi:alkylation response protein AidB-like acyl-CoA dehydrogenase